MTTLVPARRVRPKAPNGAAETGEVGKFTSILVGWQLGDLLATSTGGRWRTGRANRADARRERTVGEVTAMPTFASRLNRLFDTVYPPGRGPYSGSEAVAALTAAGIRMSAPYLSQLRSGNRTNPSIATMSALATFFGVKPAFFTDDRYHTEIEQELTWLDALRDEDVRRIVAQLAVLSPRGRRELQIRADELCREEGHEV